MSIPDRIGTIAMNIGPCGTQTQGSKRGVFVSKCENFTAKQAAAIRQAVPHRVDAASGKAAASRCSLRVRTLP
ncbi:MAG TPA: hypothetical protein VF523_19595 [Burkholderiales bacterium]